MADRPDLVLDFGNGDCADCASRQAQMPPMPVEVPGDIDLTIRDFEGFRQMMLENLALDNPDRTRWSEADMELMLIELLAAALDRMSFAIDTIFAERFLETAQWPVSVVRLLTMIDGVTPALDTLRTALRADELEKLGVADDTGNTLTEAEKLFAILDTYPQLIEQAKMAALAGVNRFESCISLSDLKAKLEEVPLITQGQVRHVVEGGITVYEASLLFVDGDMSLGDLIKDLTTQQQDEFMVHFNKAESILQPADDVLLTAGSVLAELTTSDMDTITIRAALTYLLEPLMPVGTRLRLIDGRTVGIYMRLCVDVDPGYFRSEVEMSVRQILSARPGGLFEQKNLGFGKALAVSDIQDALMALKGVTGVIISRMQMVGDPASEATGTGILQPAPNQALVLDPDEPGPDTGYYVLRLSGGQVG